VFVALGEELGLLGVVGAVGLYLVLIARCFRLSLVARSEYNRLLAVTLGLTLGFQSFIILAGTVRLIPLTGLTVPFISYGGSSLTVNYAILGLLAALSVEEETG
jgi:cell division protein FtsW